MKTAAHFLLLLLAVIGADDSDIISNNKVVDEPNVLPKRKLVRRPDFERQLELRKLSVKMEKIHTRSYTVITAPKDVTFVLPPNAQKKQTLQGSYFTTFGGVFRSSSIELVPTEQVNTFPQNTGVPAKTFVTNVLQPASNPEIDEDFTLAGKCTVTNGISITTILSHSCFYDLCVGKPTDCVNIYAGTKFEFRPLKQSNANGIATNIQNNGLLDPKGKFNTGVRKLQNQPGAPVTTTGNKLEPIIGEGGFSIANGRSALPPSFPGFCIGGIGRFAGIDCNFELITVAQRTINPTTLTTLTPTAAPVEPPSNRRDLSDEDGDQEDEDRELQRAGDADDGRAKGVIVQKIFITSNIRLPLGPKAI